MNNTLERQQILRHITPTGVHFADLIQATHFPRWKIIEHLKELHESNEIAIDTIHDDYMIYPMFRRSTLWDKGESHVVR